MNETMGFLKTDLELQYEDFVENPSARQQYKLILNSMLGKLAQKPLSEYSRYICEAKELQKIAQNVTNIHAVTENFCHVTEQQTSEGINKKGNCVVYAFITARNRIKLHENLVKLVENDFSVFYTDCDSIIFSGKSSMSPPIPIGLAFGDFREEFGRRKAIKSFSCLGRKQLHIILNEEDSTKEEHVLKVKGLSVNAELPRKKFLEDLAKTEGSPKGKKIIVPQLRRIQNSTEKQMHLLNIYSNCQRKEILNERKTFPWGYMK